MLKSFFKQILPFGVLNLWRRFQSQKAAVHFAGDFLSWEALPDGGYDNAEIADKVLKSTQAVIDNHAQYERDSVLFYEDGLEYPLLCSLQDVLMRCHGKLNVIDFGGAMGSTFWKYRKYLFALNSQVEWHVIEQPLFIQTAERLQYDAPLFFHSNLEDNSEIIKNANLVLFSSVLQYLPNYAYFLKKMSPIKNVIIDRTPEFVTSKTSQLTMQYVKEPIYNANYGMQVFASKQLLDIMSTNGYERKFAWGSSVDPPKSLKNSRCEYNDFAYYGGLYILKTETT